MRRSYTNIVLPLMAFTMCLSGCSTGFVHERFFTPDSKYLVWRELCTDCSSPVKRTECRSGRTISLGYGSFVPTADREYVLLVDWCPTSEGKRVALVRLRDAESWTLPSLPKVSAKRQKAWDRYHGDLDVRPVDESFPSVSFSVFDEFADGTTVSRYRLISGRWDIEQPVYVGDESVETTKTFRAARVRASESLTQAYLRGELTTECPACHTLRLHTPRRDTYVEASPNGECCLFERVSGWARYAELQTAEGEKIARLTTQTSQWDEFCLAVGDRLLGP
ncbi:MAG: hypothetical protein GY842_00850 [bacterium]|nr:hypothetical protein [bacterium]